MKINGFVICAKVNTWGDKTKYEWSPLLHTVDQTTLSSWCRFLNRTPSDNDWDRIQTYCINHGYCVKEVTLDIKI